jgi:hypothetical protein
VDDRTFLVLGGAGLVGYQVAHRIATEMKPERVVIASRRRETVERAVQGLRELVPGSVEIVGEWGDLFVREELARMSRSELIEDHARREALFEDLLGPFEPAYERSRLAGLIRTYRPDVVVDSVNTATAISYQDVYTSAHVAERDIASMLEGRHIPTAALAHDVETLILSLTVPQLIRHVMILHRALREVGVRIYLKIGTSGTGGMGLEIPFTHSEDRPSAKLLTKNAVAFAHTGLLFLMARTDDGPLVKEIKPSTLIGYADVAKRTIVERSEVVRLYGSHEEPLGSRLQLRLDPSGFDRKTDLQLPVVDTGENGVFTKGEFEAITALDMMEMVTPEEIADLSIREIRGGNTGRDVIAALDASVLGPTYRAGVLRSRVMEQLEELEEETATHSVALGQLGPPQLSKLLWEAELLRLLRGTLTGVLDADPDALADEATALLQDRPGLRDTITSLGLPVLCCDGESLLRGPFLRIPEMPGGDTEVDLTDEHRDRWAAKGWVDIRSDNFTRWQDRFRRMRDSRPGKAQPGSAGYAPETTLSDRIEIGAVVAWVLMNEIGGRRIK